MQNINGIPLWTGRQLQDALAVPVSVEAVYGISIDTRTLNRGDLFLALKGEQFDGHRFAKTALEKGAAAVLVQQAVDGMDPQKTILVDNSFRALQTLAQVRRAAAPGRVIGVTGSVGKTSVKDALKTLLGTQGNTHATSGNYNNHIGLPLTLARMPMDSEYTVLEMGMNHAGEIAELTMLARPDVSLITAVEAVHLEYFGTVEKIAEAKAEIFLGQTPGAVAILPRDASTFPLLQQRANQRGLVAITFGGTNGADFRLMETTDAPSGQQITASIQGETYHFSLGLHGAHQAVNMLGVLAAMGAVGGIRENAMRAMAGLQPSKGRGQFHAVMVGGVHVTVMDDSYNASPASMRAAFSVLSAKARREGGRAIAVLGDMRELGGQATVLHEGLLQSLIENRILGVLACGEQMQHLYALLPSHLQFGYAAEAMLLKPLLEAVVKPNDILLIKGSHGSHMHMLAEALVSA